MLLVPLLSCPDGCYPFKDTCACDIQPEISTPVKPSDDVAPQTGMPSYQAPGTILFAPRDLTDEDKKDDQDNADAATQGKRDAGIK